MLNIEIKKSNLPLLEEKRFVNSKKVSIDINLEGVIQIAYEDKNLSDIIEKIIIDLLLTKIDKFGDVYDSFSLVLEKLNKEIKKLSGEYNLENLSIFLGITQKEVLHFSILGDYSVFLIKNGKIIDVAEGMKSKTLDFSYISSGNVNVGDTLFLSNLNLLEYVTKEDIFEISKIQNLEKLEIIEQILSQEAQSEQFNLISIGNSREEEVEDKRISIDLIKSKFISIKDRIVENEKIETLMGKIKKKVDLSNKYIYVSLLGAGIITSILILYMIIGSLLDHQMEQAIPEEYKNKLIEAKMILERTNRDLGNKEVFDSNIKKAEELIFEVRGKELFLNDVKKLLEHISILKKQANGIETFEMTKERAQLEFSDENFSLLGIFEVSKKYYYIGKNGIIGPYIKGEEAKVYSYPDGEEVIAADVTPEGNVYLLTKSYRILQFYKQDFKYVNVEGQQTWEESVGIKTFNSNLYLLSSDRSQIFKHKPGINGFSAKSSLLEETGENSIYINDFAIDGGVYVLKKDLAIDKFFTTPSYLKKSIVINNIKNINYENLSNEAPRIYVGTNLNYLYMLMDNKIWVFELDSRNYKDVTSIRYIGQLEPAEGKLNSIYIPKDGTIYVGSEKGVYLVNFEISDDKVIIR